MNKFSVALKKFGGFMKRNAFYFLILLCIASVATVIGLAVTDNLGPKDPGTGGSIVDDGNDVNKPDDGDDKPDPPKKQTFIAPSNGTIFREYYDDSAVWYPVLGDYGTHCALDFKSDDLNVFASDSGVVKETGYDDLNGNYLVLTHENGYETRYYSLENKSDLKVGDTVTQGQNIGKISMTMAIESLDEAHLHFEMLKNGEYINPLEVLILEEK